MGPAVSQMPMTGEPEADCAGHRSASTLKMLARAPAAPLFVAH